MSLRNQLRDLDSEVALAAARLVSSERMHYSCHALRQAELGTNWPNGPITSYQVAYKAWVLSLTIQGATPKWWCKSVWDEDAKLHRAQRIDALIDFADAILKAQQPTLWERLRAWALSPCEIGAYS